MPGLRLLLLAALLAPQALQASAHSAFARVESAQQQQLARWDESVMRAAASRGEPFVAEGFPLGPGLAVDLKLTPFATASARTRFVVGSRTGPDRPLDFDVTAIRSFRGSVAGHPGSRVLLVLGPTLATGRIELDGRRYRISSEDARGVRLEPGVLSVFEASSAPIPQGLPPDVPLCGVADHEAEGGVSIVGGSEAAPGTRQLELAVETDYEFFRLFDDLDAAAAYVVALYTEVSEIYLRDVDTWVDLTYVRLWDDPDDLFNDVQPSPLGDFADYWNTYMDEVHRDVAQLLSGRRDYPFGGQATLSSLCTTSAYSVVGYAMGSFPNRDEPSPYQYDISVTAHELGHNAGTGHTQSYGIDTCHIPTTTPQRGTIMAYCGQTWSGGNANRDHYFHSIVQQQIDNHILESACIVLDCNRNGVEDSLDIANGPSPDADADGIPDECQDCNGNAVLDGDDIAATTSADLNANGIPDECEPDCDENLVPDDKQIADGVSDDAYGNDIPDECEPDCDGDLIPDYDEIQLDMTLDVDRNRTLDACQDCDGDAVPDLEELAGAHGLWVTSGLGGSRARRFHPVSGVRDRVSVGGLGNLIQSGQDLIVTPGYRVLVSSSGNDAVKEYDSEGGFVGNLVPPGAGGLDEPAGLLWTPAGTLLVASRASDELLEYDGSTGAFLRALVAAGGSPLVAPFALTIGPDGDLYVTSGAGEVLRYALDTGAFLGTFVSQAANGGLVEPRGLLFKPDKNLLVTSYESDEVLEYDGGDGSPLGPWTKIGTGSVLSQTSPWGIRIGPNGNVFVSRTGSSSGAGSLGSSDHDHHDDDHDHADDDIVGGLHLTNSQMYEYDVTSGNFVRSVVMGNDTELTFPTGFDFAPGWSVDCNFNLLPDACDVASGESADADANGTPDECETDCNRNGRLDRLDLIPFGTSADCNANLLPDECDLASAASGDCDLDGVPDECGADCNRNGVPDACDLVAGDSSDCNGNGVPDECDALVDFETDPGWIVGAAGDTASAGVWTLVNPIGTEAQTEYDHTPGDGRSCFVTGQGAIGEAADLADVDGGATTLTSTAFDLSGQPEAEIGYWRWFSNDAGPGAGEDVLRVEVSGDDGASWLPVETVGPDGPDVSGEWRFQRFLVADFVPPSTTVRLRFIAEDSASDSIVEAAVDDVVVQPACCLPAAEVEDLLLAASKADLLWFQQPGALYDVAGGRIDELRLDGGSNGAACLAQDLVDPTWEDARPAPPPEAGYYYLIRAAKSCGPGDFGASSSGAPRAAGVCP